MRSASIGIGCVLLSMLAACEKERPAPSPSPAKPAEAAVAAPIVAAAPPPIDAGIADAAPPIDAAPRKALEMATNGVAGRGWSGESDWTGTFLDASGDNQVELSISAEKVGEDEMGEVWTSRFRLVHSVTRDGKTRMLRTVREVVERCSFQITLSLLDLTLGDVDKDGIGELVFGYQLGCRSDAGPNPMKVFLVENGKKYALRGQSRVRFPEYTQGGDVDEREPEAAPAAFAKALDAFWEANLDDLSVGRDAPSEEGNEDGSDEAN